MFRISSEPLRARIGLIFQLMSNRYWFLLIFNNDSRYLVKDSFSLKVYKRQKA